MPFYQFGDAVYPGTIPVEKWVPFICKKFGEKGVSIIKKAMNMLRAIANGIHRNFTSKEVMERFPLGTKPNIVRIKNVLLEKELVELRESGLYMADPIFLKWFRRL